MAKDLSKLRKEYTGTSLSRRDLAVNPLDQFESWFSQAQELKVAEPNAMSLSTVDENGQPWQRMVLLKAFDERGFVFFTNFSSRKAKHIETNAQVSLLFPWVAIHRQVAICGKAEKDPQPNRSDTSSNALMEAKSGLGHPNKAQSSLRDPYCRRNSTRLSGNSRAAKVPLPSFWGGYRVTPESFEFWQGGTHRIHDRFLYSINSDESWKIDRLSP